MRNNFDIIRPLLNFDSVDDFYFLQIIKRRKDNPELERDMKLIDNYFIYSIEDYDKIESKIIDQCNLNNARAYIRINRRNAKTIALQTMRKLSELLIDGNYRAAKSAYISAAGEYHSEPKKRWIIDIDEDDLPLTNQIREKIQELHFATDKTEYQIIAEIPTKSGIHIITNPFNLHEFRKAFPTMDIHKDNPTLLFYS
jgi:hypothetical protein